MGLLLSVFFRRPPPLYSAIESWQGASEVMPLIRNLVHLSSRGLFVPVERQKKQTPETEMFVSPEIDREVGSRFVPINDYVTIYKSNYASYHKLR